MKTSSRRGFTLIELLVVIAIIAILAAILFPVFALVRERSRQTKCLSNMKQIGLAMQGYLGDWSDTFPLFQRWQDYPEYGPDFGLWECAFPYYIIYKLPVGGYRERTVLHPYIKNRWIWQCPSEKYKWTSQWPGWTNPSWPPEGLPLGTYAYNGFYLGGGAYERDHWRIQVLYPPARMSILTRPSYTVLGVDGPTAWNYILPPSGRGGYNCGPDGWGGHGLESMAFNLAATWRHSGGMNVVLCDGHAKWYKKNDRDLSNRDDRMWKPYPTWTHF